jgi:hypothetical protein
VVDRLTQVEWIGEYSPVGTVDDTQTLRKEETGVGD